MVVDASGNVLGYSAGFVRQGIMLVVSGTASFEVNVEGAYALPVLYAAFSDSNCTVPVGFWGYSPMPIAGEIFQTTEGINAGGLVVRQYQRATNSVVENSTAVNSFYDVNGVCTVSSGSNLLLSTSAAVPTSTISGALTPVHLEVR